MEETRNYKPSYHSSSSGWAERTNSGEEDPVEKSLFYHQIRQSGATANCINFTLRNEDRHTLPTREIEEIYYHPDKGISLFFRFGTVHIRGRNLEPIYLALSQQRVVSIRDYCDKPNMFFDEKALVVTAIHYESDNLRDF